MDSQNKRRYPMEIPGNGHEKAVALLERIIQENKDKSLDPKLRECYRLFNGLDDYLEETAEEETALQAKIGGDTYNENWSENARLGKTRGNFGDWAFVYASGYVEGQFLRLMAQISKAKRILEIGMFTGYGAVSLADSKYCEEIVCLEMEPYFDSFLKERVAGTPIADKLRIIIGRAIDSLHTLKEEGRQFDLVFVDADKGNYINYYKFIMDNGLLAPEGTILIDNALWQGETYPVPSTPTGRAIYEFNKYVKQDKRVNHVIIPLNDGVGIIHRKDDQTES